MNSHAEKARHNKNPSVTQAQPQQANAATFQFADARTEAVAQRNLQLMADNYSATQQPPIRQKDNNTGLPDNLKAGIEQLSGYAMDDVRVHRNSDKPAQLQAHAYAQGTDIHIGPGQEKHLPHEAWHVVQQMQGRVRPSLQAKGMPVNDDASLEQEADRMGAKALQLAGSADLMATLASGASSDHGPIQCVRFLSVKRIAAGGSLYEGIGGAGPAALNHNGGLTWWGPRATAQVYADGGGSIWRSTAAHSLNLVDMSAPAKLGKTMRETIRRSNNNLSVALQGVLQNHDFAYAVPQAVADTAQMCMDYGQAEYANHNGQWINNGYVNQGDVDNTLALAAGPNDVPLLVGSVIQTFADHGSANALQLDDANFLANPDNYVILRKDATNLDAGFADALLADLNQPHMAGEFHGLHVPPGMKFGGFTDTKHEILIRNSPANLTAPVAPQVGDPDLQVSDKTLGVDDSWLASAWRWFGLNN